MPKWTQHATKRWSERFHNYDRDMEWDNSKSASRKQKAKIKRLCPSCGRDYMNGYSGRRYMTNDNGIVFVLSSDDAVITVFRVIGL